MEFLEWKDLTEFCFNYLGIFLREVKDLIADLTENSFKKSL